MPKLRHMDYCYSESMRTGGGWPRTGGGSPPVEPFPLSLNRAVITDDPYDAFLGWSPIPLDEDVKPPVEELLWRGGDPFLCNGASLASGQPFFQLRHAATSRREEATVLADHALYCRKADDASLIVEQNSMDPFYGVDPPPADAPFQYDGATCSSYSYPTTPITHQQPQPWMETYQSLSPSDGAGLPADLDNLDIDWDYWTKMVDEPKEEKPFQQQQPCSSYSSMVNSPMMPFKIEESSFIKEEPYSPFEDDKMVTTEECYGVSVPAKAVAAILLKPKNKRGRPKKIRIFENKDVMSPNERRKAMNRDAALRYREKKKAEEQQRFLNQFEEVDRNIRLKDQVQMLNKEITELRSTLRSFGLPL